MINFDPQLSYKLFGNKFFGVTAFCVALKEAEEIFEPDSLAQEIGFEKSAVALSSLGRLLDLGLIQRAPGQGEFTHNLLRVESELWQPLHSLAAQVVITHVERPDLD